MERIVRDRRRRRGIRGNPRLIALIAVLVILLILLYWMRAPSSTYRWLDTDGNEVFSVSRPKSWLESPSDALRPPAGWGMLDAIFARKQAIGFPPTIWVKVREASRRGPEYLLKAERAQMESLEKYKVIPGSETKLKGTNLKRTEYTFKSPFVGTRVGARDADSERGFVCHAIEISTIKDGRLIKVTGVTRERDFEANRGELEKCLRSLRLK